MKSLLGLVQAAPCRLDVEFKDAEGRPYKKTITVKSKKDETEEVPVFAHKDTVSGEVRVTPMTTKKLEHQSIKVQLLGQIELASERGVAHEFVSLVRDLAPPGDLNSSKVFPFEFKNVEMQYDSYRGQQVRCRYLLRVTVTGKGMTQDSRRDFNLWVTNFEEPAMAAAPIKMEVGIEDCLHIEFEYDRARYHLKDVVVGRIYFLLVRIKLKHMEIEIRRKETIGAGSAAHSESETLAKYEIMDGAPVRGESVPIRLYLSPFELTPSYKDVHNKYSVRYFLNLVLVDEEDRRYFKQQEITLFRKAEDSSDQAAAAAVAAPPKLGSPLPAAPPPPSTSSPASSAPDTATTTVSSVANGTSTATPTTHQPSHSTTEGKAAHSNDPLPSTALPTRPTLPSPAPGEPSSLPASSSPLGSTPQLSSAQPDAPAAPLSPPLAAPQPPAPPALPLGTAAVGHPEPGPTPLTATGAAAAAPTPPAAQQTVPVTGDILSSEAVALDGQDTDRLGGLSLGSGAADRPAAESEPPLMFGDEDGGAV
ncbi:vacuolar protein sorting-associated protein 26-domain-containing protein [Haematococcus lacustris]